ncbi:PAS domain S-box protein [Paucibacter sp. KBW04]|uniref:PAS domain S-box protein n=1 Tax=Paucibacter sp. KBW04 TaxID=2153361 RepID=UPI000F58D81A|nr:PAS domain S-box protein [Paucibacter sp. KBW04]RQO55625.1 PAS domain S-box protein [Paucibacter sp. KBW04]
MGATRIFPTLLSQGLDLLFSTELPVGLALLDHEFRYVRINKTLADFNGVPAQEALGQTVQAVLPEAYATLGPLLQQVLSSGEALQGFRVQAEVPSFPGELSEWEASYLPVKNEYGYTCGILVQAINITVQQLAQRRERQSEERVRRVLDSLFVLVGVLTPDGVLQEANRAPLEAAGISLEEVQGQYVWDTYWWSHDTEQQEWLKSAVKEVAAGGLVRREVKVCMAGGQLVTIDFMLAPLRDEAGRITHLIPSAIDISDRVASDRALRASEARFRSAFEAAPDGMTLVDAERHILLANKSMNRLFGYAPGELTGRCIDELLPAAMRQAHVGHVGRFFATPQVRPMAARKPLHGQRLDGTLFPLEVGLSPIPGSDPPEVLATVSDVSERVAAQTEIQKALEEKTALLNEVHHRVKNNLQIISSLLRLQSASAPEAARPALQDSQARVRAMALTHQLLYERKDFSGMELGPYLHKLTALLCESYLGQQSRVRVEVQAPERGLHIDLQTAVPCGLVVNELVVNALKHAFPGARSGLIRVSAGDDPAAPGKSLFIEVSDDGIGLPEGMAMEGANSLGFQLVPLLADQMEASLALLPGPGTRVRLQIPRREGLPL